MPPTMIQDREQEAYVFFSESRREDLDLERHSSRHELLEEEFLRVRGAGLAIDRDMAHHTGPPLRIPVRYVLRRGRGESVRDECGQELRESAFGGLRMDVRIAEYLADEGALILQKPVGPRAKNALDRAAGDARASAPVQHDGLHLARFLRLLVQQPFAPGHSARADVHGSVGREHTRDVTAFAETVAALLAHGFSPATLLASRNLIQGSVAREDSR